MAQDVGEISWLEFLRNKLEPILRRSEKGRIVHLWLEALSQEEEGTILGISLALDIALGRLDQTNLVDTLKDLEGLEDPCLDFEIVAKKTGYRFAAEKISSPQVEYSRIMSVEDYITYYIEPTFGRPLTPRERRLQQRRFSFEKHISLVNPPSTWTGANDIVWVLDQSELSATTSTRGATDLADSLGLPEKNPILPGDDPELILIAYPKNLIDHAHCPTTIDGYSKDNFYLTGRSVHDASGEWGLTHSCTGRLTGIRERIHGPINRVTGLSATYLGVIRAINRDRTALVTAAQNRWNHQLQEMEE